MNEAEQFLNWYSILPEPHCLLSGDGHVIEINPAQAKLLGIASAAARGKALIDLVTDPPAKVAQYIRACSGSRSMVIGALSWNTSSGQPVKCLSEGAALRPRSQDRPALILLRSKLKESAASRFLLLNDKINALAKEIRERQRAQDEAQRQREQFRVTLSSIGDAVIATDSIGRVTFMNPVAESLTGWAIADAAGRPLTEVFNIVNEYTRSAVENPVDKVFREGYIVGLANHTVLIARDGSERPIDDSGAPIRSEDGQIIGAVLVFRDVTEQRQSNLALRESEERFAKAFNAGPLVFTISSLLTGKLIEVNDTFVNITGYSREEAIGRTTVELGLWAKTQDREEELGRLQQVGQVRNAEYTFKTRNGEQIVGLLSAERIDIAGEPCALTVIQDITARKRAEQERDQLLAREHMARLEAEQANRLKDEFLATVSHELRTPLNAILGWAALMARKQVAPEQMNRAIEIIERNARAQAQIINDILDVSRIITGKLQLKTQPVDLVPVIEMAADSVRPAAEAKNISIRLRFDPPAEPVSGDPARLQQIVWNLLSNAIKFSPAGGIVEVSLTSSNQNAEISVSDEGEGISPDFLPYVFERFRQADSSITRKYGGLGLGLAIVRHLAELHGGTVIAESAGKGRGATFRVRLPLITSQSLSSLLSKASAAHAHAASGDQAQSQRLSGLRVLAVDDEADARELIAAVLAGAGATVKTAASAAEAIEIIKAWKPDVLLSDISMPDEDGYSLIQSVRALGPAQGGNVPAAALTAFASSADRLRALAAGYQTHVTKPLEMGELITVVANLAGRFNRPSTL